MPSAERKKQLKQWDERAKRMTAMHLNVPPYTFAAIGRQEGVSRQRVQQVVSKYLAKLYVGKAK